MPVPAPSRGPRELLALYQKAMLECSADDLADLYADDARHEFGFFTPGHAPIYSSQQEIREAYRAAWSSPTLRLEEIHNVAVHETSDPSVIVNEWAGSGTRIADGVPVSLAGGLVLEAHGGSLTRVRDYMDVLGLAHRTGRLTALAAHLDPP